MKTALLSPLSSTSTSTLAPSAEALDRAPKPGRPTGLNERMINSLCSIIRETGVSDSGAAARMSFHPSTISRWKRDSPDFAILLRTAREDFRDAQLSIIFEIARSGRAAGLRAATWLLERVFPQDYAPRAAERAKFQELFDAACAREAEGGEIGLPHEGEALQNVQNSALPPSPEPPAPQALRPSASAAASTVSQTPPLPMCAPAPSSVAELTLPLYEAPREALPGLSFPRTQLQNVKYPPLTGPICPPVPATQAVASGGQPAETLVGRDGLDGTGRIASVTR